MGSRLKYVDMARGIAIMLVVSAHIIQNNIANGVSHPAFLFINSFHMPLFFAISGYIGQKVGTPAWGGGYDYLKFLKKKAIALLLPLLVWELVVRKLFFSSGWTYPTLTDVVTTLTHPGLWFLHTLFRIFVFYGLFQYASSKINKDNKVWLDLLLIVPVLLLSGSINIGNVHVDNMYLYTLFFYLGVFVSKHQTINDLFYKQVVFLISFLLFCILVCHWTVNSGVGMNDIIKLVVASCAFVVVMNVCRKNENNKISNVLSLWGRYSMEIYVVHWTFLQFIQNQYLNAEAINSFWIMAGAVFFAIPIMYFCIGFSKVAECSPILRMILFGRRK